MDRNQKREKNGKILASIWSPRLHNKQILHINNRYPHLSRYAEDIVQDAYLQFVNFYNSEANLIPLISLYRYTLQEIPTYLKWLYQTKDIADWEEGAPASDLFQVSDDTYYWQAVMNRKKDISKLIDTIWLYRKKKSNGVDEPLEGNLSEPAKAYCRKILLFANLLDIDKEFTYNIPQQPMPHASIQVEGETNLSFRQQQLYAQLTNRKSLFQAECRSKMAEAVHLAKTQHRQMPSLYKKYEVDVESHKIVKPEKIPVMGAVLTDRNNKVIARAYKGANQHILTDHCEYILFEKILAPQDRDKAVGGSLYVTLEPCNARGIGKIPCAARCVLMKLKTVYIGNLDLNGNVKNKGVEILRNGKIQFPKYQQEVIKSFREQVWQQFKYDIGLGEEKNDHVIYQLGQPVEVKNFDPDLNMQLLYINSVFQQGHDPDSYV